MYKNTASSHGNPVDPDECSLNVDTKYRMVGLYKEKKKDWKRSMACWNTGDEVDYFYLRQEYS